MDSTIFASLDIPLFTGLGCQKLEWNVWSRSLNEINRFKQLFYLRKRDWLGENSD